VSQTHLKRYLGEFDFRYNHRIALGFTDRERDDRIEGDRWKAPHLSADS
jgi:hypothetical protein